MIPLNFHKIMLLLMPMLFILTSFFIIYILCTFEPFEEEKPVDSYLSIFDSKRFKEVQGNDIQPPNTCVQSWLKPHFTICVYGSDEDRWVSRSILQIGQWETGISLMISEILSKYTNPDALFLDIGANLGIHGLYMARLGYRVWAIEPQENNLIKMYRSATKSGILDRLTFVQNGVDKERRSAIMSIVRGNNGGSFVKSRDDEKEIRNQTNKGEIQLSTVLLRDVFDEVRRNFPLKPPQIVMKVDIEQSECNAFLGSPEVLLQPQAIPVIAVIMEWTFLKPNGDYSERCPKEKVIELIKLFLHNGYTPFQVNDARKELKKLNTSNFGVDWKTNVAWLANSIAHSY